MVDEAFGNADQQGGIPATGEPARLIRHYFVDEAGDGTLFNRHKRAVVGKEGCSRFFILGLLDVADPSSLGAQMVQLRKTLLADPYLQRVPSMHPRQGKTARAFHAKDDCPEVRREVFRLLLQHELRFFAVVRDKHRILEKVIEHYTKRSPLTLERLPPEKEKPGI